MRTRFQKLEGIYPIFDEFFYVNSGNTTTLGVDFGQSLVFSPGPIETTFLQVGNICQPDCFFEILSLKGHYSLCILYVANVSLTGKPA